MIKVSVGNFVLIGIMAILFILLAKSIFSVKQVPGVSEMVMAV